MPWTVKKDPEGCSDSMPWSVVKLNDGEIVGCHATEQDADAHVAALYAGEADDSYASEVRQMMNVSLAREKLDQAIELHDEHIEDPSTATADSQAELMGLMTDAREALGTADEMDGARSASAQSEVPDPEREGVGAHLDDGSDSNGDGSEDPEMTVIATEESGAVETVSEEDEAPAEETEQVPDVEAAETETEVETEPETEETEDEESEEEPVPEVEETQGNRVWATAHVADVPPAEVPVTKVVRNDQRRLPNPVMARLEAHGLDVGVVDRVARGLFELRFRPEFRFNDDGSVFLHGYATVYGHPYEVMGGPPYGWVETIAHRACDVSVRQGADVRLLVNHDGIALARTRSGTLRLESDEIGLYSCAPSLDMRSPTVQSLVSAMQRGDMDEMSFAFRAIQQSWNEDYTERQITEVKLYDVSVVTYPANPATVTSLRDDSTPGVGLPRGLAQAQADQLRLRRDR